MTTLTLTKLAEIESAFDDQNSYLHHCDPATVAALCRVARAAIAVVDQDDRGAYVRRNDSASNAMEALRDAGLLE